MLLPLHAAPKVSAVVEKPKKEGAEKITSGFRKGKGTNEGENSGMGRGDSVSSGTNGGEREN